MTTCQVAGASCPQCAQADLRPYGNGSKWICPRCYFILPCCEGGEVQSAAAAECGLPPTARGHQPTVRGRAMPAEQLRAAAAARASWMRECLAELVSCESPSAETTALARCAALLDDIGTEAFGRPAERMTAGGRPHLLWPAATPRPVLILGHFDTVWPLGTLADWPYTVTDGIASGPGVFDMKAGIIQALAAIMLLDHR